MPDKHTQHYNTPCSPAWDAEWIQRVNAAEEEAQRAICGAHTPQGTPCTLSPNHANGRCRYHGGFDGTGAQSQNRNARIHGLYARGLQQCGRHCPLFEHCPVPTAELDQLPKNNRPTCPYEATQYQSAITDAQDRIQSMPVYDPHTLHLAPEVALLQVMVARAAAALAVQPLVHQNTTMPENANIPPYPPIQSPALTAFLRLSAEYRRYLALIESPRPDARTIPQAAEYTRREHCDTQLTPEARARLEGPPPGPPYELVEQQRLLDEAEENIADCQRKYDELPPLPDKDDTTPRLFGEPSYYDILSCREILEIDMNKFRAEAERHRRNIERLQAACAPP